MCYLFDFSLSKAAQSYHDQAELMFIYGMERGLPNQVLASVPPPVSHDGGRGILTVSNDLVDICRNYGRGTCTSYHNFLRVEGGWWDRSVRVEKMKIKEREEIGGRIN